MKPLAPFPQPAIRYGSLEGMPVRFTDLEAWLFAQGEWRQFHPADANAKAGLLNPRTFARMYPHLPPLPADAFIGVGADH